MMLKISPRFLVYTSGHCRRWRSRMEVKIVAGSLFAHCKIAYFYSVTAEKWLIISLPNFATMRKTHLSISCKIFSWIRTTKLKIHAMKFCDFIKDFVVPSGLFVSVMLWWMEHVPWQPLLGLLSWYPIILSIMTLQLIWNSGTRKWNLRVPFLQMSCSDLT